MNNEYGSTPLHMAARYGHGAVVELLLRAGADKNAANKDGETPLKIAQTGRHKDIVALLIKAQFSAKR